MLIIVLLVVLILALLYARRVWHRRHAMNNMRQYTSRVTAQVVNAALGQLQDGTTQWHEAHLPLTPIAHTRDWGQKAIMVYEFAATGESLNNTVQAKAELQAAIDQAAHKMGIVSAAVGLSPFAVVDVWQRAQEKHFSVAFQINQSTIEYVQDITRAAEEDALKEKK
ncbi:MAG: hypothetical protein LKI92_09195 [Schleiferilactobacillus harbinensis]|jgi:hypothetical protein|nr:hypothetical protein [Schleiferilactobacillus harbinensis]MCI1913182.1 hypothetical protein [Schleiferilactobacillus harbinensis]